MRFDFNCASKASLLVVIADEFQFFIVVINMIVMIMMPPPTRMMIRSLASEFNLKLKCYALKAVS